MLTSSAILDMTNPKELFNGGSEAIKSKYYALAKQWHPNLNRDSKESNEVMARINELYRLSCSLPVAMHRATIILADETVLEFEYKRAAEFELGKVHIGNDRLLYLLDSEDTIPDLFQNALHTMESFTYADMRMEQEISRYLPKPLSTFKTIDNRLGIMLEKNSELYSLRDVLNCHSGKIPPRHVGWILNCLFNICCYLSHSGLTHNSITLDTCFISPENHWSALLGGWWYSTPTGSRLLGVPEKIHSIMPPQLLAERTGNPITDLEAVRLIGRELLGDPYGSKLVDMYEVPIPIVNFLRANSSGSAITDYSLWKRALEQSYGKSEFIPMQLTEEQIYARN